jgi:HK97 family phage portal protein
MGSRSVASSVDDTTAMQHSAVRACVRLIAGVGSTLPLDQFRTVGGEQSPMELAQVLADPSTEASPSVWRYQVWSSLLLAGNAYGLITEFTASGFPRRIEILSPNDVTWHDDNGRWVTKVRNQPVDRWPVGRLWHAPMFASPGQPFGLSPIAHAARSINTGLEAEKFGGDFFTGGGHPTSILQSDQQVTPDQAKGAVDALVAASKDRRPVALGAGWAVNQIQIDPTDSQFLETQRFTVEQIARVYGVFPEMIGAATSGSSVTYANREQRAADWLTYGLVPYLVPIEESFSSLVPRPQRVKANVSAVLRSDLKTRYESYKLAADIGTAAGVPLLTVNEMRDFEDLPPVEGGDSFDRAPDPSPTDAVPSPTEQPDD